MKPASDSTASESKQAHDDLEFFLKDLEFLNGDMDVKIPIYILREAKSALESKPDTALADLKARDKKIADALRASIAYPFDPTLKFTEIKRRNVAITGASRIAGILDEGTFDECYPDDKNVESAPTKAIEDAEGA